MSASRSGIPLILISMLTACAGVDDDRAASSAQDPPNVPMASASEAWGCADPQPGHPTAAEKRAFVDEMAALATRAEERHGVPAAAITAMAIQESGYGWTRLAQNTNNVLAWKYFSDAPAGGRDTWVLECPEKGTSDTFLVFRDRAEAVDFVAYQLASSENYRADTERYRRDRARGTGVVEAVNRWVEAIADPYSSQPEAYRTALRRVMSDTYETSEGPERTLYSLSESV